MHNSRGGPIVHTNNSNSFYSYYFHLKSTINEFTKSDYCFVSIESLSQNHVLNQLITILSQLVE